MAAERELTVPAGARGVRLDLWLSRVASGGSRASAAALIDDGIVLVDGRRRPKAYRLAGGEEVQVASRPRSAATPVAVEPVIAWEAEDLLVVDKPAGLVVHPAAGHRALTLVELLARKAAGRWTPLAVHRLDRDTSGLMLVAKTETVHRELQRLIRRREVLREYLALACGVIHTRDGTIDAPIGRDARRRSRMTAGSQRGRRARTHFTVVRFFSQCTLIRVRLETGRTHQIRAHFSAIGHPLCGDRSYGGADRFGLARQFLHSSHLRLRYSGSNDPVDVHSPLPADLGAALERAESDG